MKDWLSQLIADRRRIVPARAVTHPAWIVAVFVLLVNDHIVKPAAFAEPIAGKVSDFAGLFLFPVLLATLLRVRSRRGLWLTGAATAVVFSSINVSPAFAAWFDALVSTVVPFTTTVDPTDLIALIAIPVGVVFFEPLMLTTNVGRTRRTVEAAAVTLGGLASMATSPPPCESCWEENQSAHVSILNLTNELHILRIRPLRPGIQFDCELIKEDPTKYLVDAAFAPPESWFLQSGQEIPVRQDGSNPCAAALVQSDTVPDIIVFWSLDLPMKSFAFDADVPREIPPDGQTVVLEADYSRAVESEMHEWRERGPCGERADLCGDELLAPLASIPTGARYFWRTQHTEPLHFVRPTSVEPTVPVHAAECAGAPLGGSVAWEPPPSGERYVVDIIEGRDGCHEVITTRNPENAMAEHTGWWLCAPFDAISSMLPTPEAQKRVVIAIRDELSASATGGYSALEISVFTLGELATLQTIYILEGYRLPVELGLEHAAQPIEGCEAREAQCGQMVVPAEIAFPAHGITAVPGDGMFELDDLDLYLLSAEVRLVADTTCDADGVVSQAPSRFDTTFMNAVIVRQPR